MHIGDVAGNICQALVLGPSFQIQTVYDFMSRHSMVFTNVPGPTTPILMFGREARGLLIVPTASTLRNLGFQCASLGSRDASLGFRDLPAEPTDHLQGLLELFKPQNWTT
jgi:hypothetical protein